MFFIGIDIAKKNHEAPIIDSSGKSLSKRISFSNSINTQNCIIGIEATDHYLHSIYSFLMDLGFTCFVINTIQSEAFRKMYIRQTKNDSIDSFIIA